MKKGTIAVIVSVWVSVAGTGIGLAALINVSTGRLDTRISDLAKGQAELRERMTRVETILEEVLAVAAVQKPPGGESADGTTAQGNGAAGSMQ